MKTSEQLLLESDPVSILDDLERGSRIYSVSMSGGGTTMSIVTTLDWDDIDRVDARSAELGMPFARGLQQQALAQVAMRIWGENVPGDVRVIEVREVSRREVDAMHAEEMRRRAAQGSPS